MDSTTKVAREVNGVIPCVRARDWHGAARAYQRAAAAAGAHAARAYAALGLCHAGPGPSAARAERYARLHAEGAAGEQRARQCADEAGYYLALACKVRFPPLRP